MESTSCLDVFVSAFAYRREKKQVSMTHDLNADTALWLSLINSLY